MRKMTVSFSVDDTTWHPIGEFEVSETPSSVPRDEKVALEPTDLGDYESVSALVVDLYECAEAPRKILIPVFPKNSTKQAWIPQTMGDCIWVLFDFVSKEDREEWESTLPPNIKSWLCREIIPHAITYGWQVRDANGFLDR